jgi:hypothetical protein
MCGHRTLQPLAALLFVLLEIGPQQLGPLRGRQSQRVKECCIIRVVTMLGLEPLLRSRFGRFSLNDCQLADEIKNYLPSGWYSRRPGHARSKKERIDALVALNGKSKRNKGINWHRFSF